MQSPPSTIVFEFSGFALHYYGVIMFIAIIASIFVIYHISKKYYKTVNTDVILDFLPTLLLFSILGARIYYVIMDFSYYSKHLSEIFAIWNGGMSIHGGILGGICSGMLIAKKRNIGFLQYSDVFAYGIAIGQAIGRFGNYFNCEAFGKPCDIPFLQLFIPLKYRPIGYEDFAYFHPTFLYESLWDLFVFFMLFFVLRKFVAKFNLHCGTIFFSYLFMYSFGRLFIEMCRLDSVRSFFSVPVAQLVSIVTIVISAVCLLIINKEKGKN